MDQANNGEASRTTLLQVFLDYTPNFFGGERMQIQYVFQWENNRIGKRRIVFTFLNSR
jgi:hypothetical protein